MNIVIYSRLGDLLRLQGLSVGDLKDRIATRFGPTVDMRALDRLTRGGQAHGPDFELGGAAAIVLDVGLDDVFVVHSPSETNRASPDAGEPEEDIDPEAAYRMQAIFAHRSQRPLTEEEQVELHALVAAYGQATYERGVQRIARERGVAVDVVRAELADERERAATWYHELEADPARRASLVREALERQRARAAG